MAEQRARAAAFRALHERDGLFVIPNPFDVGSARLMAAMGFEALASSSAALGFLLGKADAAAAMSRAEGIAHLRMLVEATSLPVNGDLENGYGDAPDAVAETIRQAIAVGAAGCSIEDATGHADQPLYEVDLAAARIRAARAAITASGTDFVLTARAECFLTGHAEPLAEAIRRLKAYEAAGADVVYAPGLTTEAEIRAVLQAVRRPLNVLGGFGPAPLPVATLAALGVKRVSLGALPHRVAMGGLLRAMRELGEQGSFGFARDAARGADLAAAFKPG
jgi:2-methylisocitrate lyase-like PEP mutase family enzyme